MTEHKRFSRSDFLRLGGAASLGLALTACGNSRLPAAASSPELTPSPTSTEPAASRRPQAFIPDTEVWTLRSSAIGQDYTVSVALPHTYADAAWHYPVIYVLDANALFGMVTETERILALLQVIREVIVVGMGYPVDDFIATLGFRNRDFTPTRDDSWYDSHIKQSIPGAPDDAGSGGAAQFLQFVREEIMPLIGATYRVAPAESALLGHSAGGLFALYALLTQPDTFKHYLIGSPSIFWDGERILDSAKQFAAKPDDVSAQVFMAAAGDEDGEIANMQKMVEILHKKQSTKLRLTAHVFEGENHPSVIPAFVSRGLRSAFT